MSKKPGERGYADLKKDGEKPRDAATNDTRRWWARDKKDDAGAIVATQEFLVQQQAVRMRQHVISARLYGNFALMGAQAQAYSKLLSQQTAVKDRVTFNAIQSIIDTLTSRIGETKPRPYYLTSGGSYSQQRKAKKLNQFTEGVFYETSTYDKGLDCFRDSAIWGDGLLYVFGRAGKLHHERVLSSELWVDELEAMYGFPRNLYWARDVDRDQAPAGAGNEKLSHAVFDDGRSGRMGAAGHHCKSDPLGGFENDQGKRVAITEPAGDLIAV